MRSEKAQRMTGKFIVLTIGKTPMIQASVEAPTLLIILKISIFNLPFYCKPSEKRGEGSFVTKLQSIVRAFKSLLYVTYVIQLSQIAIRI